LGQAIATLADFEVNPSVMVQTCQLVFVDELIGDVQDFGANVLRLRHRSLKVEVLKNNGAKSGPFLREDTVEEELDELQQRCICTHIARVADAVVTNVIRLRLRSSLSGWTSHTTMVWHIFFLLCGRMS
jgi:hypothetical protein